MAENKKNVAADEFISDVNGEYIIYRGKPLVREGNIICYGNMSDKYYLNLCIMNTKEVNGKEVPDKVLVQIMNTDTSLPEHKRIAKQDLKNGLGEALDIGIIWLDRYVS